MRPLQALGIALLCVVAIMGCWLWRIKNVTRRPTSNDVVVDVSDASHVQPASGSAPTNIYAHNLMLRKGPTGFRVYVRWLRGEIVRTSRVANPSFDEPESFYIDVKDGVVNTNVGDLANFLNEGISNSPVKNTTLSGDGDQLKLTGTLHKGLPLPIEVILP